MRRQGGFQHLSPPSLPKAPVSFVSLVRLFSFAVSKKKNIWAVKGRETIYRGLAGGGWTWQRITCKYLFMSHVKIRRRTCTYSRTSLVVIPFKYFVFCRFFLHRLLFLTGNFLQILCTWLVNSCTLFIHGWLFLTYSVYLICYFLKSLLVISCILLCTWLVISYIHFIYLTVFFFSLTGFLYLTVFYTRIVYLIGYLL